MTTTFLSRRLYAARQRGASLLFSLMAVVLVSLGAVALIRSVDTGSLVIGNLGFKQDATVASSWAADKAVQWLQANGAALNANSAGGGYYATSLDNLDPTGKNTGMSIVDWESGNCAGKGANCVIPSGELTRTTAGTAYALKSRYVIARLCSAAGDPSGLDAAGNPVICSKPPKSSTTNAVEAGELKGPRANTLTVGPFYRIIVRTEGARNTVSLTETIVHF
jgi:hypothetical protein